MFLENTMHGQILRGNKFIRGHSNGWKCRNSFLPLAKFTHKQTLTSTRVNTIKSYIHHICMKTIYKSTRSTTATHAKVIQIIRITQCFIQVSFFGWANQNFEWAAPTQPIQ
jgi:hypothetical protein